MLSYRHAFHAGNHADVLKHLVLVHIARYMAQKDAPFWYIDTHAGAGAYDLEGKEAQKLAEFCDGIGRLWQRGDLPPAVEEYVALVRRFNTGVKLKHYPGSPWFADQILREDDRLRLFELHSSDFRHLTNNFRNGGRRLSITAGDGFAGLKALLPPPSRRAFVLIDPSYETKGDYLNVVKALEDALKRFATGTYAVWYPRLARSESRQLPEKIKALTANWLNVSLNVSKTKNDGFGMHGSGMFIINPPWILAETLRATLPWLAETLSQGEGSGFTLEQQGA